MSIAEKAAKSIIDFCNRQDVTQRQKIEHAKKIIVSTHFNVIEVFIAGEKSPEDRAFADMFGEEQDG